MTALLILLFFAFFPVCHLLGDFFEAIKQDWEKAGKIYQVNCNDYKYGHSCFKFGNYLFTGKGSQKADHAEATKYYDKGCDLKYPEACLHSGLMRTAQTSQVEQKPPPLKVGTAFLITKVLKSK